MERRAKGVYVHRTPSRSASVVMVCQDKSESDLVTELMNEIGSCVLMTYRKVEDLALNAPRGDASLVILADESSEKMLEHSLRWLKRWRPTAAVAVIGQPKRQDLEIVARVAGANYFVRPVAKEQWRAMLEHALGRASSRART